LADVKPGSDFLIFHAGMLGFDRHPGTLFKVPADLKSEMPGFSSDLKIKLAGFVDYSIINSIKELGLDENFTNLGTIKRQDALRYTLQSQVLLLLINKAENAKGRIPGKLFELMRAKRPILALGELNSDVHKIIEDNGSGIYVRYDDYDEIRSFIVKRYELFKKGEVDFRPTTDIEEYSVENQTKNVA